MKKLMVAVVAMGMAAGSARAEYVFDQTTKTTTGGGLQISHKWTELTTSFTLGFWVKNVTAEWGMYYADMGVMTLYHAWSTDTTTWPRDNVFYKTTQVDAVGGTNVTTYLKVPTTAYCRYAKTTDQPTAVDGKWHHLVVTYNYDKDDVDNCYQRFYVDGVLGAESKAVYGPLATPTQNLVFGGDVNNGWGSKTLRQAEITLWNRALSNEEVADLATHRAKGDEQGLVGYWYVGNPLTLTWGEPNEVKGGVTANLSGYITSGTKRMVDDENFPLLGGRYLVPPEYAAEKGQIAGSGYRSWETAATNLQDALDAAFAGETIHVKPGHYLFDKEAFVTNKSVRIASCDPATGAKDRDGTVFDGQGKTRIFYSHCGLMTTATYPIPTADRPVVIDSITFTNGYAATSSRSGCGGAVYMRAQGASYTTRNVGTLANCLFVGNHAEARGGAVGLWGGFITNCVFRNNTAVSGGGAFCGIQGSTSYNRTGNTDPATVCGLCTVIQDSLFETNKVTGAGGSGGAYLTSTDANQNMYIVGCTFIGNSIPSGNGGGGAVGGMYYGCVRDCTFVGNAGGSYGSALRLQSSTFVSNCVFEANGAAAFGVVYNDGAGKMQYCAFRKNAGINIYMNGLRTIENCLFAEATGGSQVVNFMNANPVFRNCTFANNTGKALEMSHADNVKHPSFVNCIFAGNNNGGAQITNPNGTNNTYAFTNCLTSVAFQAHARIFETDTVVGAPGFKDAANGDFTLRDGGARARDRGIKWMTSATMPDLAGNPRLVNRNGVANAPDALPDIGCYEAQGPVPGFLLFLQ